MTIQKQTRIAQAKIVIIKGMMDSIPLFSRSTLEDLGMIKIDKTGGLKEPNNSRSEEIARIKKVQGNQGNLKKIIDRYSTRFQGIGKATREGQEIQIHLPIIKDAVPVAQKLRRVHYHLMEPLQKRFEEFVTNGIIENIPDQVAITSCSPIVVQRKPKNPEDIRVSLDLRLLKKSMLRTSRIQASITEDFVTEFCGKLDLNHGYHQFSLHPQSRKTMTFSTPSGNYRYKRLAFGGVNSQDLFDARHLNPKNSSFLLSRWWPTYADTSAISREDVSH